LEVCAVIAGGEKAFIARPFLLSFSMAISPLILGPDALERDLICAEKKIPNVVYSSAMAGATCPATLPAAIAISAAEFLSQLVIIQLKNPGAPVIVGSSPSIMDMKALIYAFGAPEAYFADVALTEIAHSYRLPIFNTAGQTDAVVIDAQAAAEATYQTVMALLCGADFVHGVGEMYQGRMASPEYAVLCSEIIDMIKVMMKGIEINEDTLPLDLIDMVGPKGSYVSEKHTLKHFRRFWAPTVFDRSAVRTPETKDCAELVREKTINILKSHRPKPLPADVEKELRKIERAWLRRAGLKDYPKRA
jgi:trimethylamine--corrinoid protein Co-methyltransferase